MGVMGDPGSGTTFRVGAWLDHSSLIFTFLHTHTHTQGPSDLFQDWGLALAAAQFTFLNGCHSTFICLHACSTAPGPWPLAALGPVSVSQIRVSRGGSAGGAAVHRGGSALGEVQEPPVALRGLEPSSALHSPTSVTKASHLRILTLSPSAHNHSFSSPGYYHPLLG